MINDWKILPAERLKNLFNTPDGKSAIKTACRQILKSLNLSTAPIPLKPICQKFNLKISYNNVYKKEDSFLKLAPTGFEIEISKQKNWRRNRFTIAHELTHLIIFNAIDSPINTNDRKQYDEIEKLCDIGASELLINEDELDRNLRLNGLNTEGLKFIYDKFMVSYDALFMKLSDFLNANIIIWRKYSRSPQEKNEYRVYKHFPKYKDAEKTTWLPNGCTKRHVSPDVFNSEINGVRVLDEFTILMNEKSTKCHAVTFMFPHSRNVNNNLPIFDNLTIVDELIYDDCTVMFVFKQINSFENFKKKYLKNDNR